jgi:general secretion pathway protein M
MLRLSTREMAAVVLAGAALLFTGLWLLLIEPASSHLKMLDRNLEYNRGRYSEIVRLSEQYADLKGRISTIERRLKRSEGFSILSYLEGLARRLDVKNRIVQMKPKQGQSTRFYKEGVVEIKMEKVPLQMLVRYLFQVENSPELLRIKELRIRPRFDNPDLLDARFQVSAYEIPETANR